MSEAITIQAVIHDHRIEVVAPPGFIEGQTVSVTIQPTDTPAASQLSLGLLNAFGVLSAEEGDDLDRFLQDSRREQLLQDREEDL